MCNAGIKFYLGQLLLFGRALSSRSEIYDAGEKWLNRSWQESEAAQKEEEKKEKEEEEEEEEEGDWVRVRSGGLNSHVLTCQIEVIRSVEAEQEEETRAARCPVLTRKGVSKSVKSK